MQDIPPPTHYRSRSALRIAAIILLIPYSFAHHLTVLDLCDRDYLSVAAIIEYQRCIDIPGVELIFSKRNKFFLIYAHPSVKTAIFYQYLKFHPGREQVFPHITRHDGNWQIDSLP